MEDETLLRKLLLIPGWLMDLFDSPPLNSLTRGQKVGRVFLVTVSLVAVCILSAMVLAGGIFVLERFHQLIKALMESDFTAILRMAEILVLSVAVNIGCVFVLLQVRRLDRKLMANS